MADGKQWYNNPNEPAKRKVSGNPARPVNKSGKPAVKSSGKRPVQPGKPVARTDGSRVVVKKGGVNRPAGKPSDKRIHVQSGRNPQNIRKDHGSSIIPDMDITGKPVTSDPKVQAKPSSRRPMTAQERAKAREQQKILAAQKRKEEARNREQAKIERNAYLRKNPSQKSAESRAIRNGVLGAVVVASALFVLAFVVHHLYDYIAEKPNFSFVTMGAVEHTIGAKALVVRDEDIINSENAGELVTQITEGSRVAKGQELAIVVPEDMKSVVQDLRNVQSQISDVQQELILSGGSAEAEVIYRNYNKNLSAILDSVRFDAMSGNISNLASYSSSVNVILDEREDEMSKIKFVDERISVLRSDEAVYEAQLEKYATKVNAHRPGIVSFRLDGKETVLSYKDFLMMPAAEIKGYINNSVGAISSDLTIEAEAPVVRIVQNESQYLAVYLSNNDATLSDFAVGTLHDINIRTEGISIDDCKVVRCENDASGMLITFETTRAVEALLDLRTVDIEIVINETDGMKISVSSLVNETFAPKGDPCFAVYLAPSANASIDTFGDEAMFNINIVPNAKTDEAGNNVEQQSTSVGGCKVVYKEVLADGGILVAFSTPNDFANLKKLDRLYTAGYKATFVNASSGLGITAEKIVVSDYSGMASVYTNNQGFVEEVRVILLDNDREFAIINKAGKSSVPNLNTVIITNPKTVKPGDKVG
ncbi:MAG: hypothetical protein K5881_07330 [Saccharofermentans sp.]|nr:hypothetical protein [Saccharofermentans sp.]